MAIIKKIVKFCFQLFFLSKNKNDKTKQKKFMSKEPVL